MSWKNYWDFPIPVLSPDVEEADQMLAQNIHAAMVNAGSNFIPASGTPDEQYSSPQAFTEAILTYAVYLKHGFTERRFASADWDPIKQGFKAVNAGLDFLKQIPERQGDPNARSVYDAWTGVPATKPTPNVSTGPDAAPFSPIFGGKQQ